MLSPFPFSTIQYRMKLLFLCPLMLLSFALLRLNEFDTDATRTGSAQERGRNPYWFGAGTRTHPMLVRRRDTDAPRAGSAQGEDAFPDPRSPIIDLDLLPVAAGSAASSAPYLI